MSTDTTNRPIIISQQAKKSITEKGLNLLIGGVAIGGIYFFGRKLYNEARANKNAENIGDIHTQVAQKIYASKGFFRDNTSVLYDQARIIATQKLSWKKIAQSFRRSYAENIEQYLNSFLSAVELKTFYSIFQLSNSTQSRPAPTAKVQFDTKKYFTLVSTIKNTNIRKTPEIRGTRVSSILDSNVIRLAPPNLVLGYLTGRNHVSTKKNIATLFYEVVVYVYAKPINNVKQSRFQRVWVASSQIKVANKYTDRNTGLKALSSFYRQKKALILNKNEYDSAK